MEKIKTSQDVDHRRRHFVGAAALALAAAQLGMIGVVDAQPGKAKLPSVKPGLHTSFSPLKQIDAGLLKYDSPFQVTKSTTSTLVTLPSYYCGERDRLLPMGRSTKDLRASRPGCRDDQTSALGFNRSERPTR